MAWGRRKQEKEQAVTTTHRMSQQSGVPQSQESVLGPSLVITGEVALDQNMLILGKVIGNITSKASVHVGPSGIVEGNIHCSSILVEGCVNGNVDASANITIESSGKLKGDINTKEFINRPGGIFEGYSHMIDGKKPTAGTSPKKTQNAKQHEKVGTA